MQVTCLLQTGNALIDGLDPGFPLLDRLRHLAIQYTGTNLKNVFEEVIFE